MGSIGWCTLLLAGLLAPGMLNGAIFLNQVGFAVEESKRFITNQPADSFSVVDAMTSVEVYRDALNSLTSHDPISGWSLFAGNFSALQTIGEFYIVVNGDTSVHFPIAASHQAIYEEVYRKSLKGFYYQRCGINLTGTHAGPYFHPACHTLDALFHTSSGQSGFHLVDGGWHDAGDYGKYAVNAGISLGTLLMAYEYFPERFSCDDLNIPESENGIPDILDEVRYELNWLLKMQDTSGGVFHKVTTEQFAPWMATIRKNSLPTGLYLYCLQGNYFQKAGKFVYVQ